MWQDQLRHLVHERLGFELGDDRLSRVIAPHVERRRVALSLAKPDDLVTVLSHLPDSDPEFERLIHITTIGETYFFRDAGQMQAMASFAIELAPRLGRPVRIWDAGCATGEEPYTLAILLARAGISFEIVATDVLPSSVARARSGDGYPARAVRHVPPALLEGAFERVGRTWKVRPSVKRHVSFQVHNMVTGSVPLPAPPREPVWDLIVCRNVFIYFSRDVAERVVNAMLGALSPEGALWLGAADSVLGLPIALHRVEVTPEHWAWRPGAKAEEPIGVLANLPRLAPAELPEAPPLPLPLPPIPAPRPAPQGTSREGLNRLVGQGLYNAAEAYAESRLAEVAHDPIAALTLGNLRLRRHAFAEALTAYQRVPASGPCAAEAQYLRALTLRKMGDQAGSIEALRRTLALSADFWPASFLLAGALEREGRVLQSELELERTVEILTRASAPRLFSSAVEVLDSVHTHPDEVLALARARLAASGPGAKS